MPGKSRHGKARQSLSKKRRELQRPVAAAAQQAPTPSQTAQPAAVPDGGTRPVPKTGGTKPLAPVVLQYPYVGGELFRISIVTGLILVIIFVLAVILPRP